MKSLKKRIFTTAMAGAMALSMAVPAFAAGTTTVVTGSYQAVTIDVTVPGTSTATINPYKLPIDITKSDTTTKVQLTGHQIASQPMALKNNTTMNLNVGVSITSTATGNLKLVNATTTGSTTAANNAFVYLQSSPLTIASAATNMTTLSANDNDVTDAIIDGYVAWKTAAYSESKDVVIPAATKDAAGTKAAVKDNFAVLKGATSVAATTGDNAVDAHMKYNTGSILLVRLAGDISPVVKEAWASTDGFTASIAYTFIPQ